jgi:hypothetical protein
MKVLIYAIVVAFSTLMPSAQYSPGEQAVIEYVADDYNVSESDVTIMSPNMVNVDLGLGTSHGVASFYDCGTDCTRVVIEFPDRTMDFMIIEELGGM